MMLADSTIQKYIQGGTIKVLPAIKASDIRPTGVRLHLGVELLVPEPNQLIDLIHTSKVAFKKIQIGRKGFILDPGSFVLGSSVERIKTSNKLVCQIDGRSTFARLGLGVHCTSTIFDGTVE